MEESLSPRAKQALVAARVLLEECGVEGLTMRALADRLGIKAPSLYAHFPNKKAIENALIAEGLRDQAESHRRARAEYPDMDPIPRLWQDYRRWALANPALYRLMVSRDLDRDDEEVAEAERVTIGHVLRTTGGDRVIGLAFWAFAAGMIELELSSRFPVRQDLEAVWEHGLAAIAATLPSA
jgi:AcrR family transcriptional regulator